jgi:hypothetical protein
MKKAKAKTKANHPLKPATRKVIVKNILGHKPTGAFLAALKAVAAMGRA